MSGRPLSVWLLCVGNGCLAAFLIAASIIAEDRGYAPWQAAISGLCGLGITIAAHITWYGNRRARNVLLGLLTLFLGLLALQSAKTIAWALDIGYEGPNMSDAIKRLLGSLLWLFVNYVFLLNKRARTFFL